MNKSEENTQEIKMPAEYKLVGPIHCTHTLNNLNKYEWHLVRKYTNSDRVKNKEVNEVIKKLGIFIGAIQKFESKSEHYHIPFIKSKKEFTELNDAVLFLVKNDKKKLSKMKMKK